MAGIPLMSVTQRSQQLTLSILMIGLVVWGFYKLVWEPMHGRIEMVRDDLRQLAQELQPHNPKRLDRNELLTRIKELEKNLYGENQIRQKDFGPVGLRNRVTRIAKEHQLEITYWQSEASVDGSREGIKKIPIRVQIEGGYHKVAKFFTSILYLPEVYGISQFTIGVVDDQFQNFHLQTNFVMTRVTPSLSREGSKVGHPISNVDGQYAGI